MLGDREIQVTLTEFEILAALVSQPGRVFSRAQLLTVARGVAFESYERAIDSHIRNLRRKLEAQPGQPPVEPSGDAAHILTVHGVGYKFAE
jgi:two-component system alkaline phosphatase synthesis response regulator PhoP